MHYLPHESLFLMVRSGAVAARTAKKNCKTYMENSIKNMQKIKTFLIFFVAAGLVATMLPKSPPGEPPGASRGPPGRLKSTNFSRQAAHQAANMNFWDAPGRPRAAPGCLRGGSGSRVCAQGAPRGVQGVILEPCWFIVGSF